MFKFDENKMPLIDLGGDGNIIRLESEDLTEKDREKAARELRETPEIKDAAIKEFNFLLSGKRKLQRTGHSVPHEWQ